jgi:hypothetical protein
MISQRSFIALAGIAAAAGLLALVAVGCGSSADGEDPAISKASFVKRADAICVRADREQAAILKSYLKKQGALGETSAAAAGIVEASLPSVRIEARELAALPVPKGDEADIGAFVAAIEKAVAEGEDNPSQMAAEKADGPFAESKKLGREYGFKACAFPL